MLYTGSPNSIFRSLLRLCSVIAAFLVLSPFVHAAEQITLQLKWKHQFQFAGYYAAIEKGFYREAGFDVELIERSNDILPLDMVLEGKADFGIMDSSIILQRMNGKPVVVLGPIFQHSPLVLLTRTRDKLWGPYELRGKRVMYQKGADDAVLMAMFHILGLSDNHFIYVPQNFDEEILLKGQIHAVSGYMTNEPYLYESKGVSIHMIEPLNYGVDFYDDILFANEKLLKKNPEKVQRFLKASIKGWEYALKNQEEIIHLIKNKYNSEKPLSSLRYEALQTKKMIAPDWVEIGDINIARFHRIADIYKDLGKASKEADFTGITLNEYLEKNNDELPYWVKILRIGVVLSLFLAAVLLLAVHHFRRLVVQRTQELDNANVELARYIDIVDQHVISSQTDKEGFITKVSSAFSRITGYALDELIDQPHSIIRHPDTEPRVFKDMWTGLKKGHVWSGIVKNRKKDGSIYWLEFSINPILDKNKAVIAYLSIGQDISDKKRIEHLSITDKLTGLYNRLHLDHVLEKEINRINCYGGILSVIIFDIDHFKSVNDIHGHLEGDRVLCAMTALIRSISRNTDCVGRWGGRRVFNDGLVG